MYYMAKKLSIQLTQNPKQCCGRTYPLWMGGSQKHVAVQCESNVELLSTWVSRHVVRRTDRFQGPTDVFGGRI